MAWRGSAQSVWERRLAVIGDSAAPHGKALLAQLPASQPTNPSAAPPCSGGGGQGMRPARVCVPAAAEESGHRHRGGGGASCWSPRVGLGLHVGPAMCFDGCVRPASTQPPPPTCHTPVCYRPPSPQSGYNFLYGLWKYQWDADCELFLRILLVRCWLGGGGAGCGCTGGGWGGVGMLGPGGASAATATCISAFTPRLKVPALPYILCLYPTPFAQTVGRGEGGRVRGPGAAAGGAGGPICGGGPRQGTGHRLHCQGGMGMG